MSKNNGLKDICREYHLPTKAPVKYKEKSELGMISEWNVASIEVVARGTVTGVGSLLLKFEDREPVRIASDYLGQMQDKKFGEKREPRFHNIGEIRDFIAEASSVEDLEARCSLVEKSWKNDGFPTKDLEPGSAQEDKSNKKKKVNDYPQELKELVRRLRNELAGNIASEQHAETRQLELF